MQNLKVYSNVVVINGVSYTNTIKAETFAEALEIQRDRKRNAKHSDVKFVGRITFRGFAN